MGNKIFGIVVLAVFVSGCVPELTKREVNTTTPESYIKASSDTLNSARTSWRTYFDDPLLAGLIDEALVNNQELNIVLQEVEMTRNEVKARKGEYLPFVDIGAGGGVDKVGRYTRNGALEATTEIKPGKEFPEPLGDMYLGAYASWEIDVWKKLRNAKAATYKRYLASMEGRNFLVTNLIAEIASNYYELLALNKQLDIVKQNIQIQSDALTVVKLQKESARVTELAVKRFEAQVAKTKSLQFEIQQNIIEVENEINFLVGRYPQRITINVDNFDELSPDGIRYGLPAQLLDNRPDIRQAELELQASKLDIKSAKAKFYPSVGLQAGIGFQAFNPSYFVKTPESLMYALVGDLASPLINRNAIKAEYQNANARQIQAIIRYEQTILNAYIEVVNQLSNVENLQNSYDLIVSQVQALEESVIISNNLFRSARADYMEVLLTQREALESRFDLIETKMQQMQARVNIYRALGGGWN
ncbi:TolC family protein [Fulvivirga lutea]|uniref:TolC family protein n=1 Tax=Fulvivirga lutea TaxID=2810512 RepID=A0A974WHH4_9BACT|nr:TolC family protein [Fulvivirga lutea]QSE98205.1 TolC family protein [Fulvivirga lutea]